MARSTEKVSTISQNSLSLASSISKPTRPPGRKHTSGCTAWSIADFMMGGQFAGNGPSLEAPAAFGSGQARSKNRKDYRWKPSSRPKFSYESPRYRVAVSDSVLHKCTFHNKVLSIIEIHALANDHHQQRRGARFYKKLSKRLSFPRR